MKSVCVIGSINKDLILTIGQFPTAGQNIYAHATEEQCGGKGANVSIALAKLGVSVLFYACIGNDANGLDLKRNLEKHGVSSGYITVKDTATGAAYIMLDTSGDNRIIVAPGANEVMTKEDIQKNALPLILKSDIVLTQLETSTQSIQEIIALCAREKKKLIVDAGPIRGIKAEFLRGAYCVSPNQTELAALLERDLSSFEDIQNAAKDLLSFNINHVLVKLGKEGSLYVSGEVCIRTPAYPVKAVDPTAAGDSFMAGYCKSLLDNKPIKEALNYATKCGAVAVTKMGATPSLPSLEDIENFNERWN